MTNKEVETLGEIIKIVSSGAMKSDDKILDLITYLATKTRDIMLEMTEKMIAINDRVVDLDERLHRLENKK